MRTTPPSTTRSSIASASGALSCSIRQSCSRSSTVWQTRHPDTQAQDRRIEFILAALRELDDALRANGGGLIVLYGNPADLVPKLANELRVDAVFANHDYEPVAIERDECVRERLAEAGRQWLTFKDQVIFERAEVLTGQSKPFTVFTPFAGLQKPAFNPPNWVFPPAWTVLYVLMAISVWRVWKRDGASTAIVLWVVQLLFNAAWMWLFFGLHRPALALADIVILLVLIVALTFVFWRRDRWAGILLVPYVAWVAFAAVLNYTLRQLNPAF